MFTTEENHDLDELAADLAYRSIQLSGLYRELENEQWDRLAIELAREARKVINRRIQERIDKIEAQKEAA